MTTKKGNDYVIGQIKSTLQKYGWCIWMGIIYGLLGILPTNAIFWITYLPLIILVNISKRHFLDEKVKDIEKAIEEERLRKEDLNIFR